MVQELSSGLPIFREPCGVMTSRMDRRDATRVLRDTRRRAKVLAVIFLTSQWAALTGCSESLASLQGFIGPLMSIFGGAAGVSSFDEYDTSDANFQRNRDSWGAIAGGLSQAGGQLQRREAANANMDNLPGEVEELYGQRDGITSEIDSRQTQLDALGTGAENAEERARLREEISVLSQRRREIDSGIRQRETLLQQSAGVLGRDVTTQTQQRNDQAARDRAARIAEMTDDPNDTWEDHYTPVETRDTSGRTLSRQDARNLANNAQMAASIYSQYGGS